MAKSVINATACASSTLNNAGSLCRTDAGPLRNTPTTGSSLSSRSSLPRPVISVDKNKGTLNATLPRSKIPNLLSGKYAVSRETSAGTLRASAVAPGGSLRRPSGTVDSNAVTGLSSRASAGTLKAPNVTQLANASSRAVPSNGYMQSPRKESAGTLGSSAVTNRGSAGILKTISLPRRNTPRGDAGTAPSNGKAYAVPLQATTLPRRASNVALPEKPPGRLQQPTVSSRTGSVPAREQPAGPFKDNAGTQNPSGKTIPKPPVQQPRQLRPQRSLSGLGKNPGATVTSAGPLKRTLANGAQSDPSRRTQQRTVSNLSEPPILPVVCVFSDRNELIRKERFTTPERITSIPKLLPSKSNPARVGKESAVNKAASVNKESKPAKTIRLSPAPVQTNGPIKANPKVSSKIPRVPERMSELARRQRLPKALDAGVKDNDGAGIPHVSFTRKPSLDRVMNSRAENRSVVVSDPAGTGPSDLGYVSEKEKSPDDDDDDDDGEEEFLFDDIAKKYGIHDDDEPLVETVDTSRILDKLLNMIPKDDFIKVVIDKTSQGLGFSITGGFASGIKAGMTQSAVMESLNLQWDGFIRIKKIFPHGAAWQSGQLQPGDVLLSANGIPLSGLSHPEALEVLRCCPRQAELFIFRNASGMKEPDTPEVFPQAVSRTQWLSPAYPLSAIGEFEVVLTKVNGSLGFTLRKEDESVLGHYVRALVKEPALTDGRIKAGDKIVSVNNVDISSMTHAEAIAFLRRCPDTVTIRFFRDSALTPLSPLSPVEPEVTVQRPRPVLRREAQDLLQDLAARKQQLGFSSGSAGSTSSFGSNTLPRRKRLTKTTSPDLLSVAKDRYGSLAESNWSASGPIISSPPMSPLPELDTEATDSKTSPRCPRKETEISELGITRESSVSSDSRSRTPRPNSLDLSNSTSLKKQRFLFTPPGDNSSRESGINSSTAEVFPRSSSSTTSTPVELDTQCGLVKWKGVIMSDDLTDDLITDEFRDEDLTVELNKGWSSRLGFSVGLSPHGRLCITAIYDDSVAAKDGRLQVGDHVLRVNGETVDRHTKEDVIDLLRKTRGPVSITVRKTRANK